MRGVLHVALAFLLVFATAVGAFAGGQVEDESPEQEATEVTAGEGFNAANYATLSDYTAETGNEITSFNEAPMLAEMVAAGDLPPVEERLPVEPLVVKPADRIGKYGGKLRAMALNPTGGGLDADKSRMSAMFRYAADFSTLEPNVAQGWEFSPDNTSVTITLREGLKWSDGDPVTTEDVMFAYESIWLNQDLTPVLPSNLSPGGEFMKVVALDDYTFRLDFSVPYPPILSILALRWDPILMYPKHYLSQFHPDYNENAEEEAIEAGFDGWISHFDYQMQSRSNQQEPDRPTLESWVLDRQDDAGNRYFLRNPYYFKIDTEGNQLPYIDQIDRVLVENREVRTLRIVSGEADFAGWDLPISEFTLYKENESAGDYRVSVWPQAVNGRTTYDFNYGHPDPFKRELFNDLRFRQAMSVAINREEINEVLAFGEAVPMQATSTPSASFYEEWMGQHYAQYDPDLANELLDEIGLEWDEDNEWRLGPDGRPIQLTIESRWQIFIDYSELVKEYWENVGLQVAVRLQEPALLQTRRDAGEIEVGVFYLGESLEPLMFQNPSSFKIVNDWASYQIGNEWEDWIRTGGDAGIEPPEDVIRQYEVAGQWQQQVPGSEEYLRLGKEMLTLFTEGLRSIGVIGMPPIPIVFKSGLANVPLQGTWQGGPLMFRPYQPEQWYWEN
jgi:peptide/nickel transport system substrate-binding protein